MTNEKLATKTPRNALTNEDYKLMEHYNKMLSVLISELSGKGLKGRSMTAILFDEQKSINKWLKANTYLKEI